MSYPALAVDEASILMRTIVIGLGNPMLGDGGAGWKVAGEIKQLLPDDSIKIACLSLGGLGLMVHLIGYERAILIDSLHFGNTPGKILVLKLSDLPDYSGYHVTSPRDTSLQQAMAVGRSLGVQLPEDVTILGIVTRRILDFSNELSKPVANAIPQAAQVVYDLLKEPAIH